VSLGLRDWRNCKPERLLAIEHDILVVEESRPLRERTMLLMSLSADTTLRRLRSMMTRS